MGWLGARGRLPFLPAGVGRARGRRVCGECAGCLWARERYAMSALRCFITSKAKLGNENSLLMVECCEGRL